MPIEFTTPELTELKPKITVIGVGGAGGNAVNNMIAASLQGVDFVVSNTDAQALAHSAATQRIQLGAQLTQGLGAGARPEVGKAAAEETMELIDDYLAGSHMVFITAGMGGGTGTGAAPVIAQRAREKGMLTVGVVTKPFQFEGSKRMRLAEEGIKELQKYVDTLIIIPNQNLFRIANEKTTFADAFVMADEVLNSGVRGVTDLIVMPGLVNLDFADVRTVMSEMGKAMMGTGEAEGENRALEAAEAAISNPLLDEVSMKGARGVLINITGGMDLTLFEVDEAANRIRAEVDPDANILVGSALDDSLQGRMRVSVVATGIEADSAEASGGNAQYFSAAARQPERKAVEPAPVVDETLDLIDEALDDSDDLLLSELDQEDAPEVKAVPSAPKDVPFPASINLDDLEGDMPFIAPEPQMPKQRMQTPVGQADPFAEAAMENGPVSSARENRGLFSRFTRRKEKATPTLDAPKPRQTELPVTAPAAVKRPLTTEPEMTPSRDAATARLGRLDATDRITGSNAEDDQLEIPAFLRRQAN